MTHRDFSDFARVNSKVQDLLATLVAPETSSSSYRSAMQELGRFLASGVLQCRTDLVDSLKDICIVCTVEDADFLAQGVMNGLHESGIPSERLHLQCFWNERIRSDNISLAPIVKEYEEPFDGQHAVYLIVKSIISGACVVKTNLTRVLSQAREAEVFVVAPVLLDGAQQRLEREFPPTVSERFQYVWFATDFKKDARENVVPGIGGSVYERLGLGKDKNQYVPKIVQERRQRLFGASASA